MSENNDGGAVEGFTLSGEELSHLEDVHFLIYALTYYKEMKSLDDPSKMKRKLIIPVELKINGTKTEWVANKTSQRVIIKSKGRILQNWVGYVGEFVLKNQVVGKDEKK